MDWADAQVASVLHQDLETEDPGYPFSYRNQDTGHHMVATWMV